MKKYKKLTDEEAEKEVERISSLEEVHEVLDGILKILYPVGSYFNAQVNLFEEWNIAIVIEELLAKELIEKAIPEGKVDQVIRITQSGRMKLLSGGFEEDEKEKIRRKEVDDSVIEANKISGKAIKISKNSLWVSSVVGALTLAALLYQIYTQNKPTDVNIKQLPELPGSEIKELHSRIDSLEAVIMDFQAQQVDSLDSIGNRRVLLRRRH